MKNEFDRPIAYFPARLYEGKEWYVGFYVLDPKSGSMKRIKRKLNRIKSVKERRNYGRKLAESINRQLANGWNPFIHSVAPKSLHSLKFALNRYVKIKESEVRGASSGRYKYHKVKIEKWLHDNKNDELLAAAFDAKIAIEFMNYIWTDVSKNAHTYNNYLSFMKSFSAWMIEQQFCAKSAFDGIRAKRVSGKSRSIIPPNTRAEIKSYLTQNDPEFLILCFLVFHCLIRPGEILKLRVRSIDLSNQVISIPAETTKTGVARISTIPNIILNDLETFITNSNPSDYLFSIRLRPGRKMITYKNIQRRWYKMKDGLDLPKEYKIYSLRDSGIVQKLNDGISPEEVMKQAGHTSLQTTTIYVNHANPKGSDQVKNKTTSF